MREVAEEVRVAFGMCQKILTEDLQIRSVTAKFVSCLLMAEQFALTSMSEPKRIPTSCPQ